MVVVVVVVDLVFSLGVVAIDVSVVVSYIVVVSFLIFSFVSTVRLAADVIIFVAFQKRVL